MALPMCRYVDMLRFSDGESDIIRDMGNASVTDMEFMGLLLYG